MALLMLSLCLPLWLCCALAQSSYLDSYLSFPGKTLLSISLCAHLGVCVRVCACMHFTVPTVLCAKDYTDVLNIVVLDRGF